MQIKIPTTCPCCQYPLERVNDQLFCRNTACGAQLGKKLEHFAKVLGIKGLGPKTIEKLNLDDLCELYSVDEQALTLRLGSKTVAAKLYEQITISRDADLATVLAAFSIPLIGNTAATKLCTVITSIDEISAETCKQAGLGAKATDNLMGWLNTEFLEMRDWLPFSFKTNTTRSTTSDTAQTVCISGKLTSYKNKAEATAALTAAGFKVTESVTKTTSYLVDEENRGSTKRVKAESLGITIIPNLPQFLKENT